MKPADKAFLDGLRKSVCVDISQDHWDLVVKAVDDAGDIRDVTGYARTIILEGVEKAKFSSRSEAGRYAANMRWKGQGDATRGAKQADEKINERRKTDGLDAETSKKIKSGNLEILANMIRRDLRTQGKDVPFGAKPYLDAMSRMNDVNEMYGADDGKSIVAYALSNLASYKGETARAIKAELKARMQGKAAEKPEQEGTGFDSPKMKEQLAYEAKRDQALGAKAADIADAVSERDEPARGQSSGANSEEAKTKQAFIDAQKERLERMGRGTSQGAYMALESGIKKLEAELASGDTSEARNRPGQFFDDRPGAKGEKYIGRRPVKEVAVDIRRDLKDAVANGDLPTGLKFSVKSDTRGSNAVRVRVSGTGRTRDESGRLTGEAKAVYEKVSSIVNAYNRDNSDMMTDYFDTDYYGFTDLDD